MKKTLTLVATVLFCTAIQAQIVSSRSVGITSTPSAPSETQWYLRAGLNLMNFTGDGADDLDNKTGYNVSLGFQKPLGDNGTYWGMNFGLGQRGYKYSESNYDFSLATHNIHYSPFTLGWKYGITDNVKIDLHAGIFASFDYMGKITVDDGDDDASIDMGDWKDDLGLEWTHYDAGANLGFGFWFDRFNLDFTYQRGFIDVGKVDGESLESFTNNFMIRLGIAF